MTDDIDEAMARALQLVVDAKTGVKPVDEFTDNMLISLGTMIKTHRNVTEMNAPASVSDIYLEIISMWKQLCETTIHHVAERR